MPSTPEDPDLLTSMHVQRAVHGDEDSIAWLISRLAPVLLAQAEWRLGPMLRRHYDPHDLVHEAWLVLLPRMATLPPRDGRMTPVLLRFLSTTILSKARNLLRREARRSLDEGSAAEQDAPEPAGPRSEVVSAVVRSERDSSVRAALEELPEEDRKLVLMRGVEQLPAEDVAAQLSISRDALSKRYRRALARLCERLPGSVFDELTGQETE